MGEFVSLVTVGFRVGKAISARGLFALRHFLVNNFKELAGSTGLEPAASAVTE